MPDRVKTVELPPETPCPECAASLRRRLSAALNEVKDDAWDSAIYPVSRVLDAIMSCFPQPSAEDQAKESVKAAAELLVAIHDAKDGLGEDFDDLMTEAKLVAHQVDRRARLILAGDLVVGSDCIPEDECRFCREEVGEPHAPDCHRDGASEVVWLRRKGEIRTVDSEGCLGEVTDFYGNSYVVHFDLSEVADGDRDLVVAGATFVEISGFQTRWSEHARFTRLEFDRPEGSPPDPAPLATLGDALVAAGLDPPKPETSQPNPDRNEHGHLVMEIVETLVRGRLGHNRVRLSCGHEGYVYRSLRAGCPECTAEADGDPWPYGSASGTP